jgi:hypothetical protein
MWAVNAPRKSIPLRCCENLVLLSIVKILKVEPTLLLAERGYR